MFKGPNIEPMSFIGGHGLATALGVSGKHRLSWKPDRSSPVGGHLGFSVLPDRAWAWNEGFAGPRQAF